MSVFDNSLQHHEPFADGMGHKTFARCESCMWGSHYETVTWHSWAGPDDIDGKDTEYIERVSKQKCACDCAGPRGATS